MQPVQLRVKRLPHCKALPAYASAGAAGLDLVNALEAPHTLAPGERMRVPTGVVVEIPPGYEGQVRPRSGLADKAGISLTNCVGTIDCDYRGEVMVLVINHGQEAYTFRPGERVAQLVVTPVPRVEIVEIEDLVSTSRGDGGFGSTGR
ncbi:MAG TPA: dUTP diphosphatase [Chroococcales cyanobacterium]